MQKIRIIAGLIVSALILGWLASKVQLDVLWDFWPAVSVAPVLLAALAAAALVLVEAWRLRAACSDLGASMGALVKMQLVAVLLSNFGLGQAGGDLYRVVALKAFALNYGQAAFRVLATRVIGLFSVVALGLWGMAQLAVLLPVGELSWQGWAKAAGASVAAVTGAALVLSPRLRTYLVDQWVDLRRAFDSARLRNVVALSFLIAALRCLQFWLLLLAVGVTLPFSITAAVVALTLLASTLPVSYGSWGVREGVIVALLVLLDASYEQALVVAIFSRTLLLCVAAAGAMVLAFERSKAGEAATPSGNLS